MDLIICLTPLHTLIAQRIIEYKNIENYDVLYIVESKKKQSKSEYYYRIISEKSNVSLMQYIDPKSNRLDKVCILLNILSKFRKKYNTVYIANFENLHSLCLLSYKRFNKIETFDDGIGNIVTSSAFYRDDNISFKRRLLRIKYNPQTIKNYSSKHYTIFKNFTNIIDNTKFLPLYDNINQDLEEDIEKTITIFLGQPLYETDMRDSKLVVQKILDNIKPDYYFPHPREVDEFDHTQYINTNLIFEDYIIKNLEQYKNIHFEVISIFSTALINVYQLPRITAKFVDISNIKEKPRNFSMCLKIFRESGIEAIEIDI